MVVILVEYDFEIKHIKGKENKAVNALNIRVHAMHATSIRVCRYDLIIRILLMGI